MWWLLRYGSHGPLSPPHGPGVCVWGESRPTQGGLGGGRGGVDMQIVVAVGL